MGAAHKEDQTMIGSLELSTTPLTHPSRKGELEMEGGTNVASIQVEAAEQILRPHSMLRNPTLDVRAASVHPSLSASLAATMSPPPQAGALSLRAAHAPPIFVCM